MQVDFYYNLDLIYFIFIDLHVSFGGRNILQEPYLHKKTVHPNISDEGSSYKEAKKKTVKRTLPMDRTNRSLRKKVINISSFDPMMDGFRGSINEPDTIILMIFF